MNNPIAGRVVEQAILDQPAPIPNLTQPAAWDILYAMMKARDELGQSRYGTRLTPFDGRENLTDLIQEQLDALVYTIKELYQREYLRSALDTLDKGYVSIHYDHPARLLLSSLEPRLVVEADHARHSIHLIDAATNQVALPIAAIPMVLRMLERAYTELTRTEEKIL